MQNEHLACFKAYDIRGRLGKELNEDIAYRIGSAFVRVREAKRVVVGRDIRHSSERLKNALAQGILEAGAEVIDIGMTGTEEVYFASFYLDVDGGIEVTASHNPIDYNGMKLVGHGAQPISGDSGLSMIRELAESSVSPYSDISTSIKMADTHAVTDEIQHPGYKRESILAPYIAHILSYIDLEKLKPLRLVVNAGNGAAGHVIDAVEKEFQLNQVPVEFIKVHHEPDGSFPNGIPNPLLPENRLATREAIKQYQADLGIAWDGDFDRCFLFDENARFIEGYYIVGLLAEAFLRKDAGQKIIHDPRLTWNTVEQVMQSGGIPIQSKTGHAFIKERMRLENAIYGGEMSAHHYFRDFAYCDSGMIPWLLVLELLCSTGKSLSQLVYERMRMFPCSGEINFHVENVESTLNRIVDFYDTEKLFLDRTDGLGMEFEKWRFNLRASNTEPLLRLNVESRADPQLLKQKVEEIVKLIKN